MRPCLELKKNQNVVNVYQGRTQCHLSSDICRKNRATKKPPPPAGGRGLFKVSAVWIPKLRKTPTLGWQARPFRKAEYSNHFSLTFFCYHQKKVTKKTHRLMKFFVRALGSIFSCYPKLPRKSGEYIYRNHSSGIGQRIAIVGTCLN